MDYRLWFVLILTFVCYCKGRSYQDIMNGDVSITYTSDENNYENFHLKVVERNYIYFKVKACSDVHIVLTKNIHNFSSTELYEIVIGGWFNSYSVIKQGVQGVTLAGTETYDILHCGEFRGFWIHWSSTIAWGRGSRYYEDMVLSTERSSGSYFDIHYVALSTGFGHTGVWELSEGLAYTMRVRTPDVTPESFQYHTRSVDRKSGFFTFRVRTCHDIHVAMGPTNHDWKFRVNLCAWNNTEQCIWHGDGFHCQNRTQVCSCEHSKHFWLSWKDNIIRAGMGMVINHNELVAYKPQTWSPISFLSFSTGWGANGTYYFNENLENTWLLTGTYYSQLNEFENWARVSSHTVLRVGIYSCGDVWLCLSEDIGVCDTSSNYMIFIDKDNARTGVSKGFDNELASTNGDFLHCERMSGFWISWANRAIKVGYGDIYGYDILAQYLLPDQDPDLQVSGVGLGTRGTKVMWEIQKNHVDEIYSITGPETNSLIQNFWMTTYQELVVYFRVKGRKDVTVYLSDTWFYPDEYGYEVIIGKDYTNCVIREKRDGSYYVVIEKQCGEILSDSEWRGFWISWKDSYIQVGAGYKYGERLLLQVPELIPHAVNGIGVGSETERLQWSFNAAQGEHFTLRTDTHTSDPKFGYKWVRMSSISQWTYFEVSGAQACLGLSLHYGDASQAYFLHFGEEQNTRVALYDVRARLITSAIAPNLMHPDEMVSFWLSWQDGRIQLGKGRSRGKDILIDFTDGKYNDIAAFGLSGLGGYVANWRFSTRQGVDEASLQTNGLEDNQQFWMSLNTRTDMVFSVQACTEAHMWFGSVMYSENWYDSYLLVLQDMNGNSFISAPWHSAQGMNRKIEVIAYTPNILSCDEERYFWVSWQQNELIVGQGLVHGENILLSFHDFDPIPVRAYSVHTYTVNGIFRYPLSSRLFAEQTVPPSNALTAGEIVGAVFGFLLLTGLFGFFIFIILRPPDALKPYFAPPPQNGAGGGTALSPRARAEQEIREQRPSSGFSNPLSQA